MPAAKRIGRLKQRPQRESRRHAGAGEDEEGHFSGGVETQAEEHADRVHLPGSVHAARESAEETHHEAARVKMLLEFGVVEAALAHLHEQLDDTHQDDQVENRDEVQEAPRDQGADEPAVVVQARVRVAYLPTQRVHAQTQDQGQGEDHRGVSE